VATRSIIAKQQGDSWAGRYAHWDGYPTHNGAHIWRIVKRDGVDKAVATFVDDHFYWSAIDAGQSNVPAEEDRWEVVEGYGIAGNELQGSADEWYTPENYKDSWCDYVYVIAKAGLMVIDIYKDEILGLFRWDEAEPDWQDVQDAPYRGEEEEVTL
jgi:hypothetical protein